MGKNGTESSDGCKYRSRLVANYMIRYLFTVMCSHFKLTILQHGTHLLKLILLNIVFSVFSMFLYSNLHMAAN